MTTHLQLNRTRKLVWLVTMSDLIGLMLTFFVMLFSMSHLQGEQWGPVVDSLNTRLNPLRGMIKLPPAESGDGERSDSRRLDPGYLNALLRDKFGDHPGLRDSGVIRTADRVIVSLPQPVGKVPSAEDDSELAQVMTNLLAPIPNPVEIHGYADASSESPWAAGAARAGAFAEAMTAAGYDRGIRYFGHAEARIAAPGAAAPGPRLVIILREAERNAALR